MTKKELAKKLRDILEADNKDFDRDNFTVSYDFLEQILMNLESNPRLDYDLSAERNKVADDSIDMYKEYNGDEEVNYLDKYLNICREQGIDPSNKEYSMKKRYVQWYEMNMKNKNSL